MTMPDERFRAVIRTEKFLIDLLHGKYIGRTGEIWEEARRCLKHYPGEYYVETLAENSPDILQAPPKSVERQLKEMEADLESMKYVTEQFNTTEFDKLSAEYEDLKMNHIESKLSGRPR